MELLNDYLTLRQRVFDYFGYVEAWRVLPFDDRREYYWRLTDDEKSVEYGPDDPFEPEALYEDEVYTQRHLPKWIYRGSEFTMILVDTHTDFNQFLAIYDNAKEVKE